MLTQLLWRQYNLAWAILANVVGGIVVVYAIGVPVLSVVGGMPLSAAFFGSLAFMRGDIVKAVTASALAVGVRRAYPVIEVTRPGTSFG